MKKQYSRKLRNHWNERVRQPDSRNHHGATQSHREFFQNRRGLFLRTDCAGDQKSVARHDRKLDDPVKENRKTISVSLQTTRGSAEIVEKLVEILRHHYESVNFIIPDYAMSAGTLFALSGDKIYMDYSSSLSPVNPQVYNGTDWVPALTIWTKWKKWSRNPPRGKLTDVEALALKGLDLALLPQYERPRNLTITLLEKWLAQFKFRNWTEHRSNHEKKGKTVTDAEKKKRAEQIAENLSNNKIWYSHGLQIGLQKLQKELRLEIEDYSINVDIRTKIRCYVEFLTPYLIPYFIRYESFLHSRNLF